jgi:hypothetical protein
LGGRKPVEAQKLTTPTSKTNLDFLQQGPRLTLKAKQCTPNVNEAYLAVNGAMVRAFGCNALIAKRQLDSSPVTQTILLARGQPDGVGEIRHGLAP